LSRKRLGEVLVEMGLINPDQLHTALEYAKQWHLKLGKSLVAANFINEHQITKILSSHIGVPMVDLAGVVVTEQLLRSLPKELAIKLQVFPLGMEREGTRNLIKVAMSDPADVNTVKEIEFGTGCKVHPFLAEESQLAKMVRKHYLKLDYEPLAIESEKQGFESMQQYFPAGMNVLKPDGAVESSPPAAAPAYSGEPVPRDTAVRQVRHTETPAPQPAPAPVAASPDPIDAGTKLTALLRLLVKKGVISKEDYLAELQDLLSSRGRI
jgi:type IV pilus assembly protein PilB